MLNFLCDDGPRAFAAAIARAQLRERCKSRGRAVAIEVFAAEVKKNGSDALALLLAAAAALAPDHRWSEAAARARFGAWARPVADATFTVAVAPADARAARLSHFGAFAFADELATSNAANVACRRGRLRVNGAEASGARVVAPGDVLTRGRRGRPAAVPAATVAGEARSRGGAGGPRPPRAAAALYEDDAMAVVLKPAGVHSMSWKGSLKARQLCLDDVLPLFLEPSASGDALPAPLPRHRLDARVAGPVVVSKTRSAHAFLGREFERGRVAKEYRALLVGGGVRAGVVDAPLDGRPATTRVEVLGETRCAVDCLVEGECPSGKLSDIVEPWFLGGGKDSDAGKVFAAECVDSWSPDVAFQAGLSTSTWSGAAPGEPKLALIAGRTVDNPGFFQQALDSGATHILLEKPGAPTVGELESMAATAEKADVPVFMGFIKNIAPYFTQALDAYGKHPPVWNSTTGLGGPDQT
ncbi:hypothetical protein JL721_11487 [Aureococcus anophagefferens]|nr:hypothetical protein JL721_11487 [Aureococcus anophagefferens]